MPLDGFRVTVLPTVSARFVGFGRDEAGEGSWTLNDLCPEPDYAAAVAYRAQTTLGFGHPGRRFGGFIKYAPA
jgi:hypothetical protein